MANSDHLDFPFSSSPRPTPTDQSHDDYEEREEYLERHYFSLHEGYCHPWDMPWIELEKNICKPLSSSALNLASKNHVTTPLSTDTIGPLMAFLNILKQHELSTKDVKLHVTSRQPNAWVSDMRPQCAQNAWT